MTADWVQPAISAAAALIGAAIGAGAVLLNGLIERRTTEQADRLNALTELYAAASSFASFAHREPTKRNLLDEFSLRLEERMQTGVMLQRLFAVTDTLLRA